MSQPAKPRASRHTSTGAAGCHRAALGRILTIHERLGSGRQASATTLAAELEVSRRTVKRDIEFMRDTLGAPIIWEPSPATYFYEKPCDILPLLRLTADEALALALAGQTFAAWRGSPRSRERGPIEAGFRSREIRAAEPHLIGEAAADLPPPRLRRTDKAAALHSTA